ncbi:flippase [Patescibacteria group bacterium]|nr:MAG: flippase [Patescibacteria group bacterium]
MAHSAGSIVRNTVWYTGAVVGQKVISFGYFWLLSSRLAPETLGVYLGVLSVVSLAAVGTDLGLLPLLTREAAKHEEEAVPLARTALAIKLPLVALTGIVLWVVMMVRGESLVLELLVPASFILLFDAVSSVFYALFRARQMVWIEAWSLIVFQTTTLVLGTTALVATGNPVMLMAALSAASCVNMLFLFSMGARHLGKIVRPDFNPARARHLLRLMPAFAFSNVFQKVYNVADSVLLLFLSTPRELGTYHVGIYAVPAKVTTALQTLVPGAFATAIYPSMSNYAVHARERLAVLFERSFAYLLMLVLPMSAGLFLLTDQILATIWPQYGDARLPFLIMSAALPVVFLAYPTGSLLNAIGMEKRNSVHRGITTAVNVGVNIALIPRFGVTGAALAFMASNVLLFGLDFTATAGYLGQSLRALPGMVGRILLAAAVMSAAVWLTRASLPLPASVLLGFLVYGACLLATRVLTPAEVRVFLNTIRRRGPETL